MPEVTYDPIFTLIQTPADFKPGRQTTFRIISDGQEIVLFEAEGAGCIRHFWMTAGTMHSDVVPLPCTDRISSSDPP